MCKIIFSVCLLFLSGFTFGQFSDSVHHHFTFSSNGTVNKTKTANSFVLTNAIGFEINARKIGFNAAGSWVYGEQDKKLSNNDISVSSNIDFLKDVRKFYYWALANYDKSYSLNINYRVQAGVGVGYTFVKTPKLNLGLTDGFVYETNDLVDPALGKDKYQTVRNSLRLKYKWTYSNRFILQGVNFVQPSLSSFEDYILKFNNQLAVKLNDWLAVNATMDYNKISRTNRENLLITYGLTVSTYF